MELFKDEVLNELAKQANVAQFVSFDPSLVQRFNRIRGHVPNDAFPSVEEAISTIVSTSPEGSVNVRSFDPVDSKSREFVYGLKSKADVLGAVRRLSGQGLYTIVNETIDKHDGGVSGVCYAGVCEFAPDDTPRCVESPGTLSLPFDLAMRLLRTVYGFNPELPFGTEFRVEFSIHPLRRGFRHDHTVVWEREEVGELALEAQVMWPNNFSRMIGDKAFGLLLGHTIGLPVPTTVVITRRVAPFMIGTSAGTAEPWIRTCPTEQVPGYFTTQIGWVDPFRLTQKEDPNNSAISSVLSQESVDSQYSGASIVSSEGVVAIEGVRGYGDAFMQGLVGPEQLPAEVDSAVRELSDEAQRHVGPVRLEWAYDGKRAWVLQMHRGAVPSVGRVIYPGQADSYERFEVSRGIEALRLLIQDVEGSGIGIALVGRVGVTSHFGDLLRRARVPSHVED